ncbi:MAG: polyprenyl synthetase family protein [Geminicoccales bacterium]
MRLTAAGSTLREQPAPDKLKPIQELVAADMEQVNRLIVARLQSSVSLIPQLAGHLVASGGKRVRPMLTLIAARLCNYEGSRHQGLAASVEFIHTATLLHDDVVDDSDLRRGSATANALWGNKPSVLVGDFLFARAFQLMVEDGSLDVLRILSNASALIAEGEVAQLTTANDTETKETAYMDVIKAKTATLFAAAAELGAIVAERPTSEADALRAYGENLGIVFQLVDDVLDYNAREADLGKAVGDDFRDGKITLPVVLAFERGTEEERGFWQRTLEQGEQTEDDLAEAIGLMKRHGTLEDSMSRATDYAGRAKSALAPFDHSPVKQAMLDLVDFCIERIY